MDPTTRVQKRSITMTITAAVACFILGPVPTPAVESDGRLVPSAPAPLKVPGPEAVQLPPPPPRPLSAISDSIIAEMVSAVDEDSIRAFLERLTGEVPVDIGFGPVSILSRYYKSFGNEVATQFLGEIFTTSGYDVEYQYIGFGYSLEAIVVDDGGKGLAAGGSGHALRSDDGGAWLGARVGIETQPGTLRAIDHVTADDYVLVGNGGFIATTADAGQSWTPRTSNATGRLLGVDLASTGAGWIAGRDGVILNTTDGGVTWIDQESGGTTSLNDVVALDELTGVVCGGAGTILRTVDGGSTWIPVASGTSQNLTGLSFAGDAGWAVGGAGTILSTTDGGQSWSPQTSGTTAGLTGVSFANASDGWVVGSGGAILHTADGGVNWTVQTAPVLANLRGVHGSSATRAWAVGLNGTLIRTTDGGSTWENRNSTIQDGYANVVATKLGTTSPDEEVLLVGHFDSISDISNPADLAPGADDNGSGIAAIVESARQLAEFDYERTIRFIAFTSEEIGLGGSAAYAARAAALGTNLVGVFNLDAVGWNDGYFRIFSDEISESFGDVAYSMALTHAPLLLTFHWFCDTCSWSDHWSFQQLGFPAIVGIETWDPAPPQHHTVGDTLGLMDIPLVANVTRIALSTTATVAGVDTSGATGMLVDSMVPTVARLHPGVPNPASGSSRITYELPIRSHVSLKVYDVGGREVRTLVERTVDAGSHRATWDGRDAAGHEAAPGVYFLRLEASGSKVTRKQAVVR